MDKNQIDKNRERLRVLCNFMIEKDASDLHISAGVRPFIRINGTILPTEFPVLERDECEKLIFSIMTEQQKNDFQENKAFDFAFGEKDLGRFRINVYQQRGTIAAAIRRLRLVIPTFEELGLPVKQMKAFSSAPNGLILVSGPTGSGKTTTLAAMIGYINRVRECHIISLEDPIEYIHSDIKSLIHQREIGIDAGSFSMALKYILREDPDVVLIGELRDLETITSALTISETGHLVLATLHTGDAIESVRRIVDVFPASQQSQVTKQLSFSLIGVINQMLLPAADQEERYIGTEILIMTPAISNLIREYKIEHMYSHLQMGTQIGMQTMNQSLFKLIKEKKITQETGISRTSRPKELIKMLESNYA